MKLTENDFYFDGDLGIKIYDKTPRSKYKEIKQEILVNQRIVNELDDVKGTMDRIIEGLDYGSMKEEVELLKYIKASLENKQITVATRGNGKIE